MAVSQVVIFSLLALVGISSFLVMIGMYQKTEQVYDHALSVYRGLLLDAAQTSIHIMKVSVSAASLYVTVGNNGSVSLYQFPKFAVVVEYYANISGVAALSLSLYVYTAGTPSCP